MAILNVNARFPGATHDAAIWDTSTIKRHLLNRFTAGVRNAWIIGDAGYPLQPWLMTPVLGAPPNTPEAIYSHRQAVARNIIERTFGVLKTKFRCLNKHRVLHYNHAAAGRIIYACEVLHNICLQYNLVEDPDEDEVINDDIQVHRDLDINNDLLEEGRLIRRRLIETFN